MKRDRRTRRRNRRQDMAERMEETRRMANMSTITTIFAFASLFISLARVIPLKYHPRAMDVALDLFWMGAALMLLGMLCWWMLGVVKTRLHTIGMSIVGALLTSSLLWYMVAYPAAIEPARAMFLIEPLNPHQIPLAHIKTSHRAHHFSDSSWNRTDLQISISKTGIHLEDQQEVSFYTFKEQLPGRLKIKRRENELLRSTSPITPILAVDRCTTTERTYRVVEELGRQEIAQLQAQVYAPSSFGTLWLPPLAHPDPMHGPEITFELTSDDVVMRLEGEEVVRQERCDHNNVECAALNRTGEETCAPTWDRAALAEQIDEAIMERFGKKEPQFYLLLVQRDLPMHHLITFVDTLAEVCQEPDSNDWRMRCRALLDGSVQLLP